MTQHHKNFSYSEFIYKFNIIPTNIPGIEEIYIQQLADHKANLAETLVATEDKEYRHYRTSSEKVTKPLPQQKTVTTTKPIKGNNMISELLDYVI